MPAVKQGGGYTLTFAKKNKDVETILNTKKENGVVITDYLCEAVRFYEKNKDNEANGISELMLDEIINKKMELLKKELLSSVQASENNSEKNSDKSAVDYRNLEAETTQKINTDDD